MAKIRHIAFYTDDPERMARFYIEVFGMRESYRMERSPTSGRAVFITDDYMEVALIEPMKDKHRGIHHFGFTIEDLKEHAEVMKRLKDRGVEPTKPPADRPYIEDAVRDPDGNKFDISTTGMRT
jgi:catechol 2,3-dioxygenase-like lactoylglutathione lyase family enzyme